MKNVSTFVPELWFRKFHEKAKIVRFFMNLQTERSCYHIYIYSYSTGQIKSCEIGVCLPDRLVHLKAWRRFCSLIDCFPFWMFSYVGICVSSCLQRLFSENRYFVGDAFIFCWPFSNFNCCFLVASVLVWKFN